MYQGGEKGNKKKNNTGKKKSDVGNQWGRGYYVMNKTGI